MTIGKYPKVLGSDRTSRYFSCCLTKGIFNFDKYWLLDTILRLFRKLTSKMGHRWNSQMQLLRQQRSRRKSEQFDALRVNARRKHTPEHRKNLECFNSWHTIQGIPLALYFRNCNFHIQHQKGIVWLCLKLWKNTFRSGYCVYGTRLRTTISCSIESGSIAHNNPTFSVPGIYTVNVLFAHAAVFLEYIISMP